MTSASKLHSASAAPSRWKTRVQFCGGHLVPLTVPLTLLVTWLAALPGNPAPVFISPSRPLLSSPFLRCCFPCGAPSVLGGPGLFFRRFVPLCPLPLSLLSLVCLVCRLCCVGSVGFFVPFFGCFLGCDPAIVAFRVDVIMCGARSLRMLSASVVPRLLLPPFPLLLCQDTGCAFGGCETDFVGPVLFSVTTVCAA